MRLNALIILAPICIGALSSLCPAATLNFDDLPSLTDMSTVSPYNGLNWSNYISYTDSGTGAVTYDAYPNGVVSQPGALFSGGELNSAGNEITGTFSGAGGSSFTLNSAYLGAAHYNGQQIVVAGFNGVVPVFSDTLTLTTTGAQKFLFEETGLTSVTITPVAGTGTDTYGCGTFNCTQFTMDNLEINDPIPASIPEPSSFWLMGIAAVGLTLARRFRSGRL